MTVKYEAEKQTVRALTKDDIDRRIETLVSHLADPHETGAETPCPRWISTRELMQRLSPFIVLN